MDDPACAHRLDPGWMRELRHMAGLNGWVFADYFDGEFRLIRDELLAAGRITSGARDGQNTYELTDAGWAWCRGNAAA